MRRQTTRPTGTTGFTLVELLVVTTIIAILMSCMISAIPGTIRMAKQVSCGSNMSQLDKGYKAWAGRHAGNYPKHRPAIGSSSCGASWVWVRGGGNIPEDVAREQSSYLGPGALAYREFIGPEVMYCPANRWESLRYRVANPPDVATGPWWPEESVPPSQSRMQVSYVQRSAIEGNRSPNTALEKSYEPVLADAFDDKIFYETVHPDGFNVLTMGGSVKFFDDPDQNVRYNYGVDGDPYFTTRSDIHEQIFKEVFSVQ